MSFIPIILIFINGLLFTIIDCPKAYINGQDQNYDKKTTGQCRTFEIENDGFQARIVAILNNQCHECVPSIKVADVRRTLAKAKDDCKNVNQEYYAYYNEKGQNWYEVVGCVKSGARFPRGRN